MKKSKILFSSLLGLFALIAFAEEEDRLQPIVHHAPDATVDLAVGLWGLPVPCDKNGDGLTDLVVVAAGMPKKIFYFENTGKRDPKTGAELFKKGEVLSDSHNDITPSYLPDGSMRVLGVRGKSLYYYPEFLNYGIEDRIKLPFNPQKDAHKTDGRIRGNQWSYVDYDGDGKLDLIAGIGDWTDYGWDNAYNKEGKWTNGPLHGYVYLLRNVKSNEKPKYAKPLRIQTTDGKDVDVYGNPSPMFADFRKTGKLDLICGEFVDGFTYFENVGTREKPEYAPGRKLVYQGKELKMHLEMIVPVAYDFNKDGNVDLIVGQEDGRVAILENTGRVVEGMPEFLPPRFFRQEADVVKFGVLSSPVCFDWDGDGLVDIVTGNAAGEIAWIKNLGPEAGAKPGVFKWAEPELLCSEGNPIRFMAGYNGSIQGPAEAKWGYTNISVGDWDGDGLADIMVSDITCRVYWFKNIGTRTAPKLGPLQKLKVDWSGAVPVKPRWNWWDPQDDELVVQWRCTPLMVDLEGKGSLDLVTLDPEGYLALYRKVKVNGEFRVKPGERVFRMEGVSTFDSKGVPAKKDMPGYAENTLLRMNAGEAGKSGRRTYAFVDWDGDGKLDLLVNSYNVNFYKNISKAPGEWLFRDMGRVDSRRLAGHSTTPAPCDVTDDGKPDLFVGAEDGFFYFMESPYAPQK